MSGGALKSWLADPSQGLAWIEFEAYARRVFANAGDDWYQDAPRYAGTVIQAQNVIPTRCLSVDIAAPCMAAGGGGRLALDAVLEGLADSAALAFIDDVLNALVHRFAGQLDIVLKVPSPSSLILSEPDQPPDFDALDDVAGALTSLIRRQSDKPVAALLLECASGSTLSDDELDACEPLMGAARHYDWCTALSFPAVSDGAADARGLDIDVLVLPGTALGALPKDDSSVGGGLARECWAAGPIDINTLAGKLLYGLIPADAEPETVLSVLGPLAR